MSRPLRSLLVTLALLALVLVARSALTPHRSPSGRDDRGQGFPGTPVNTETTPQSSAAGGPTTAATSSSAGFRTPELLAEHFHKHGAEFGATTPDEYLAAARALRDRPAGGAVLEARRQDGVITRFDRASGAFLAFDGDGTIRTFFKPNAGEAYFRRQLDRPH